MPTLLSQAELLGFIRPHGTLKFGREIRAPAMQAGLVKQRLMLREIFVCERISVSTLVECE